MVDLSNLPEPLTLWSIDPGQATGWSSWVIAPDAPIERTEFKLIAGGLAGFRQFALERATQFPDVIVSESFSPDGRTRRPDLSPHSIQNYIAGLVDFARSARGETIQLVLQPNTAKPTVRKEVLLAAGLWVRKQDSGWTDGRDINDAALHALSFAKSGEHGPTLERYWPDDGF